MRSGLSEPLSSLGCSLKPGTLVLYCCCFLCSGSAHLTAKVLEHVCVTCQNQYKIAEILRFSLYKNTYKCGRERRGAKASACSVFCQGLLFQLYIEACILMAPLSFNIKSNLSAKEVKFCFSVQIWLSSH